MNTPYLIQRAKFDDNPNSKGIDKLLSFEYMGSSEFEWGALPASLKRIRANISDYVAFQYQFDKYPAKPITVLCKKEHRDLVGEYLVKLSEGKFLLKEYCGLDNYLNPTSKYRDSDFWWDIDNDWFFWKTNAEFEAKFMTELKGI